VGKCPNCGSIIGNEYICSPSKASQLGHQMYAVAHKNISGKLEFSVPRSIDLSDIKAQEKKASELVSSWEEGSSIGHEATPFNPQYSMIRNYGITEWLQCFNDRQFLTLVTYVKILQEVKGKLGLEHEQAKVEAISTYLALVLDRCVDVNCRLAHINTMGPKIEGASGQHSLNLIWNYPEVNGASRLWPDCLTQVSQK
jgi:putative DNA methylase